MEDADERAEAVVAEAQDEGGPLTVALLERALREHFAQAARAPLRFVPTIARDLLEWRWRRFEVDSLTTVLRVVERDVAPHRAKATIAVISSAPDEKEREEIVHAKKVRYLHEGSRGD